MIASSLSSCMTRSCSIPFVLVLVVKTASFVGQPARVEPGQDGGPSNCFDGPGSAEQHPDDEEQYGAGGGELDEVGPEVRVDGEPAHGSPFDHSAMRALQRAAAQRHQPAAAL